MPTGLLGTMVAPSSSPTGTRKMRWRRKVMWLAGMSWKSYVTKNIFTTVLLGLNKVWGQRSIGMRLGRAWEWIYRAGLGHPEAAPVGPSVQKAQHQPQRAKSEGTGQTFSPTYIPTACMLCASETLSLPTSLLLACISHQLVSLPAPWGPCVPLRGAVLAATNPSAQALWLLP